MGYRTYALAQDKPAPRALTADAATGTIESPFFKAVFDAKRGRIASLIDKRTGRELVAADAPHGFGQYLYERFGYKEVMQYLAAAIYPQYGGHRMIMAKGDTPKDTVYASAVSENMSLTLEKSAIDVSGVMTGTIAGPGMEQRVSIRLTLPADQSVADIEVGWQKQPEGDTEAGWICLPLRLDKPRFRLGRLGADMDPAADVTVDNVNNHLWWVNTGVAVYEADGGGGVGVCPIDSPMVSLGAPGVLKFDKRFAPRKPYVYVHLYNNQWQTNFCNWVGSGKRMTSRVRLWTFDKFQAEPALFSPSMEARTPLRTALSDGRPGKLPPAQAGITLSRKGVAVTAFGPNPDGPGTILRLWEQGGTAGEVTVTLPTGAPSAGAPPAGATPAGAGTTGAPFTTAMPVNLRGQKLGDPAKITAGTLKVTLRAYAPASLVLD